MNNLRTITEFKQYMLHRFAEDVVRTMQNDNDLYQVYIEDYWGFYEGTIRAAVWAVLRKKLPKTWFVQAECPYPEYQGKGTERADVLVWSPRRVPFVVEVKPGAWMGGIKRDIVKMKRHIAMKTSSLQTAYMVFPIIYGYWKLESDPDKNWKKCDFCWQKGVGKSMPYGHGDCKNCDFTTQTLEYIRNENVHVIPLYIKAFK